MRESLDILMEKQIVSETKGRYFGVHTHINLSELGEFADFKSVFISSLKKSHVAAFRCFHDPRRLFLSSAFSVKREALPELKAELRNLLSGFVQEAESSEGDAVVSLTCSLV